MKIHIPEFRAMAKCNQHLDHGPIDIDLGPNFVEVTRCKDCKHKLRTVANGFVICREKHGMIRPSLDDFCSYGEYQTNTGGVAE